MKRPRLETERDRNTYGFKLGGKYCWESDWFEQPNSECMLPAFLFNMLKGYEIEDFHKYYETEEKAMKALLDAKKRMEDALNEL